MIHVAVGIIIQYDGTSPHVLLCQRKRTARYGLKWEFPGGKVEEAESTVDGLRRELFEELGIEAKIGRLFHRQSTTYADGGTFGVSYYLVPTFTGEIANRAFETIRWVPVAEIATYDILEGNREVVQQLVSSYAQASSIQS
ncbi:MAG: (deoxy)nucleoside triphosphate pyrophosphohydrolase [Ignavibacteriae bacterium]|nr:(deoxy)nucleoside triphosphate pyrophosphohydrolase [Ignavibacteria bacterium]MBI3364128.1 (deoxy)nucleoside triphosphate pyrophosphohydrolase [Ignavibacteriota bacterium]